MIDLNVLDLIFESFSRPFFSKRGIILLVFVTGCIMRPAASLAQDERRVTFLFLPGRKPAAASTVSFCPYFPLNEHVGAGFRSNFVWKKWRVMGDSRFLYYPQYTWGLRGNPEVDDRVLINYKYLRAYQTVYRKIRSHLFAGMGYMLDMHYDMDTGKDSLFLQKFTQYHYGTGVSERSTSSGLSLNLLYDDREQSGNYVQAAYRFNPSFLGSSNHWHSLYIDMRKYIPLSEDREHLLTFWGYYWTALQSHAPFLDLPSIGWDPYQQRSARGFPQNRYRGNSLLYGEAEYRTAFVANGHLGFACFANVNTVSEMAGQHFSYVHPAAGGGIRLKFSKLSTARLAIDCGFSDGYAGVYFNLGSSF